MHHSTDGKRIAFRKTYANESCAVIRRYKSFRRTARPASAMSKATTNAATGTINEAIFGFKPGLSHTACLGAPKVIVYETRTMVVSVTYLVCGQRAS